MFKLNEKCEVDRNNLKVAFIMYSPSELSTINTPKFHLFINIPREYSVISLLTSYLDLNFDVIHAATNNNYADDNDIRLVYLGPFALFSKYKMATFSAKHTEEIGHAHIVCLMYKLITSARDTDDLSICFDHSGDRRRRELTDNKNLKGKNLSTNMLKDVFGFAEHQEKATCGLGYKLT